MGFLPHHQILEMIGSGRSFLRQHFCISISETAAPIIQVQSAARHLGIPPQQQKILIKNVMKNHIFGDWSSKISEVIFGR